MRRFQASAGTRRGAPRGVALAHRYDRADCTPAGASSRLRRAARHLHRMAEPAAFMFTEPLSALTGEGGVNELSPARRSADVASEGTPVPSRTSPPAVSALSDLGVRPGTAASGSAAPGSLSALTETGQDGVVDREREARLTGKRRAALGLSPVSVSAFSVSPPRHRVLPGIPENALNNPTRREH